MSIYCSSKIIQVSYEFKGAIRPNLERLESDCKGFFLKFRPEKWEVRVEDLLKELPIYIEFWSLVRKE